METIEFYNCLSEPKKKSVQKRKSVRFFGLVRWERHCNTLTPKKKKKKCVSSVNASTP